MMTECGWQGVDGKAVGGMRDVDGRGRWQGGRGGGG